MKKAWLLSGFLYVALVTSAQTGKTELYDFIKKVIPDSTGYENVGDWSVNKPKAFPVKWKTSGIQMSPDTSINFYRAGTADFLINGKSYSTAGKPLTWNILLKGPRMGYSSFSMLTSPSKELPTKFTLDSLFGQKPFQAKLLKSCDTSPLTGFYYYEVKLPKKDLLFLKLTWLSMNGNTAFRIDGYDSWSSYAAKLACPAQK